MPEKETDNLPPSPISRADQDAIVWAEMYESYQRYGFDRNQAFELTRTHAEAFWNAAQQHRHDIHGCPACGAEDPLTGGSPG